jgi:FtsZ-binding cell division protein ZapB
MNAEQIEILGTLRSRIKELMNLLELERVESKKLKEENGHLLKLKTQHEKRINDLEHKNNTLKIAKSMALDEEEIHDARIKVNRMVREIDKCIALLNN